jgi:hypothetical protein
VRSGGHREPNPIFADAIAKVLSRVKIEIVNRFDQAKGFVTLPKRSTDAEDWPRTGTTSTSQP